MNTASAILVPIVGAIIITVTLIIIDRRSQK